MSRLAASPKRVGSLVAAHEGALSRAELAHLLGVRMTSKLFETTLLVAYKHGIIDFCGGYIVSRPGA